MEVRPDILEKLLCSVCGEYLSCAPVRIKNDGEVLCGRCCDPEDEPTLRSTAYEHLAEMMLFPCVNKLHGCTETLYMADMKEHEEECVYRQYVCPVTESGQCDWFGPRKNILSHCMEQHPDNLLQDPYTIQHQINETNHKTFLLAAFQMLFIVHCKVCITTKNIYYSVRLIGKSALASQYKYELELSNSEEDILIRKKDVAPQGCMSLQEDMSVHVDFNTILKFLGNLKDVTFKVKVGRKCVKCRKCVIRSAWPTDEGWSCEDCAPARRPCEFNGKGCSYTDIDEKVYKHEIIYCKYGTCCLICKNLTEARVQHYESAHSNVMFQAGAICRIPVVNERKYFIIASEVGQLFCGYSLEGSRFMLIIWAPLHTVQLSDYKCVVKLTNPVTGYAVRLILPPLVDNTLVDYQIVMIKDQFLMYVSDDEFDMQIELKK